MSPPSSLPNSRPKPIASPNCSDTAAQEVRGIAGLLASKSDDKLLGRAEFEVRDRVHKIGAKAIETALNERKKGGTRGPA